jgi:hypothetical protein
MSKTVHSIIENLFASPAQTQRVDFEWRLVRRRGRPFLLLPGGLAEARTGLNLYSAQRRRAKILRKVLPVLLQTPLAGFFERIRFQADASSAIIQFMAQQAGVQADRVFLAAVKLSEVGSRSRLALLLCDESGRPTQVIKVGLNPAGREATDREADFLAQLPAGKNGCIRMAGRLVTPTLSVFSTNYFPGTSPQNDAGMEHLFHDWLNPDETIPLASLPLWTSLAAAVAAPDLAVWQRIHSALAERKIHTTLYHGDFAPWNIRVINSRNLQAFDWEHGSRQGIPGWDWFHFTIQTAILARRYSAERTAAEVEQLIHSPRFKKYAAAAGISDQVEPLVLAYLLHQRWVIKPSEGGQTTAELFDLLAAHWLEKPSPAPVAAPVAPVDSSAPGWLATICRQLNSAARQWSNLFWEPSLNFTVQPSWRIELKAHWLALLVAGLFLTVIADVQYHSSAHLMFLPFYIIACVLLTWKAGRRWGALVAAVAAVAGPLVVGARDAGFREPEVVLWNTVMRFIILEMCVLFVDRIHKQREIVHHRLDPGGLPVKLVENWVVLLGCGLFLAVVAVLDDITDPRMIFLPLYVLPCMMVTLVLNLRWGVVSVFLATCISTGIEYFTNKFSNYTADVFIWNFNMRLAVSLLVLVLLNRIRQENILFFNRKPAGR